MTTKIRPANGHAKWKGLVELISISVSCVACAIANWYLMQSETINVLIAITMVGLTLLMLLEISGKIFRSHVESDLTQQEVEKALQLYKASKAMPRKKPVPPQPPRVQPAPPVRQPTPPPAPVYARPEAPQPPTAEQVATAMQQDVVELTEDQIHESERDRLAREWQQQ